MPNVQGIRTRDTVSILDACKPDAKHRQRSPCWCVEGVVQAVYATDDFQRAVTVDIEVLPGRFVCAVVEFAEIRKETDPERRFFRHQTKAPTVEWFGTHTP